MIWLARENSRSPVRIATLLPHTAWALGTPRRLSAASITSSWYRDPRWVISSAVEIAAGGVREGVRHPQFALERTVDPLQACLDSLEQAARSRSGEDAVGQAQLARDMGARRCRCHTPSLPGARFVLVQPGSIGTRPGVSAHRPPMSWLRAQASSPDAVRRCP